MGWLINAFIATVLFGVWGFLSKLATSSINSLSVFLFQMLGGVFVTLLAVGLSNIEIEYEWQGGSYGFLVGVTGMLATLFFTEAISKGSASIVSVVTALSPLFTIALAFVFLKESLSLSQGMGVILGLFSIVLLSFG
ncbi:MAG: DMT family transporter [Symploca sp. SIO1A3]|nr:DMT family transporter [Symploca sp. SIO2C1]NER50751.1 DMT family transporter [Symploca sp. SIO1A3]